MPYPLMVQARFFMVRNRVFDFKHNFFLITNPFVLVESTCLVGLYQFYVFFFGFVPNLAGFTSNHIHFLGSNPDWLL